MSLYQSNASGNSKVRRVSEFEEVNKALYEWYVLASSKNIYPGGPELIAKAKEIAERLEKPNFKGSNGWLCKWKERYNIKEFAVCGESGDVQGSTIDSWKERLPEIVSGYTKETIIIWTRPESSGGLCLVRDLERKEKGVREESSQNTE